MEWLSVAGGRSLAAVSNQSDVTLLRNGLEEVRSEFDSLSGSVEQHDVIGVGRLVQSESCVSSGVCVYRQPTTQY